MSAKEVIKRSNIDAFKVNEEYGLFEKFSYDVVNEINILTKFEGYLKQQEEEEKANSSEFTHIEFFSWTCKPCAVTRLE